jgi:hypothetical protein
MRIGTICLFMAWMCCLPVTAQKTGMQSSTMKHGENIVYDLYFKWGLLMPRAGEAAFLYKSDRSVAGASSLYRMDFKTTKFFDGFYKMRDTLVNYFSNDNRLIYSIKRTDEGGYYAIDELTFNYGVDKTSIHSLRYTPTRVRIDTMLTATGEVTDMLGAAYYLRGINRKTLKSGDTFPVTVAVGRDLVNVQFIYQNQSIVDRGNVKFNTLYFKIDILDDAFESTNTSAEIWIGDDDNFIPVKLRSKLKIGYAEGYYKSSSGLAHPLLCRIELKK